MKIQIFAPKAFQLIKRSSHDHGLVNVSVVNSIPLKEGTEFFQAQCHLSGYDLASSPLPEFHSPVVHWLEILSYLRVFLLHEANVVVSLDWLQRCVVKLTSALCANSIIKPYFETTQGFSSYWARPLDLTTLPRQAENEDSKRLRKHVIKSSKMLPCSTCGKCFDRPSLLKRHTRTHTGEKPHICDVCSKGFSTSSSLNTHRRIHSGERPHICPVCFKTFTASSNLYYHRITHVKEKPHKCRTCGKSFPTPGNLKTHSFSHTGCWPYKCTVCVKGFAKSSNLRNHVSTHHGKLGQPQKAHQHK